MRWELIVHTDAFIIILQSIDDVSVWINEKHSKQYPRTDFRFLVLWRAMKDFIFFITTKHWLNECLDWPRKKYEKSYKTYHIDEINNV